MKRELHLVCSAANFLAEVAQSEVSDCLACVSGWVIRAQRQAHTSMKPAPYNLGGTTAEIPMICAVALAYS